MKWIRITLSEKPNNIAPTTTMSHEIIKPYDRTLSTVSSEWHGLAEVVETITPELLEERGIFFPIKEGTAINALTDGMSFSQAMTNLTEMIQSGNIDGAMAAVQTLGLSESKSHKTIIADVRGIRPDLETPENDNGMIQLHLPRKSYNIITNRRVYEVISKAFEKCPITSAGTLQAMQVFFMSLDIGDNQRKGPRGETFMQNLTALTSHNGTIGTRFYDSSVRVVCMNTVRASLSNRGVLDEVVYHTAGAEQALCNVSANLEAVMNARNEFFDALNVLDTVSCDVATARNLFLAYTASMAEAKGVEMADYEISTQVYNRAEEIGTMFVRGKGNQGANLYDAWNALTECFTHGIGAGKTATPEDKFTAGLFGAAAEIKEGYLSFLNQPEDVRNALNEQGAKLLATYAQKKA